MLQAENKLEGLATWLVGQSTGVKQAPLFHWRNGRMVLTEDVKRNESIIKSVFVLNPTTQLKSKCLQYLNT